MVACPLSSIILAECVHLLKFLAKSGELCMKTRTQIQRCTMKLRSRHNTSITQYFVHELIKVEQKATDLIKCKGK